MQHESHAPPRPAGSRLFPWYDSQWLTRYVEAKAIIRAARPGEFQAFVDAFRVFWTRADFEPRLLGRPFDVATLARIRAAVSSLRPVELELHEAKSFGRFVVHGHPLFNELQHTAAALVSEAVGEPVEASYNFLSLYGAMGNCPVHMDAPIAKWTLDLCVDQSQPWPLYVSRVQHWPDLEAASWDEGWEERIKRTPALGFAPFTLRPGEALVFSGSSQWHYRDALPRSAAKDHCDLLFLHLLPRGSADLARPANWAGIFDFPELAALV